MLEDNKLLPLANDESKVTPVTSQFTASALQLHPDVTVIIDEAASKLKRKSYYKFVEKMYRMLEEKKVPVKPLHFPFLNSRGFSRNLDLLEAY